MGFTDFLERRSVSLGMGTAFFLATLVGMPLFGMVGDIVEVNPPFGEPNPELAERVNEMGRVYAITGGSLSALMLSWWVASRSTAPEYYEVHHSTISWLAPKAK